MALVTELLLKLNDQITPKLKTVQGASNRAFKAMSRNAKRNFAQINKDFNKSAGLIRSGMGNIFKGVAIAAPLVGLAKLSSDFEKGMAEIATVTDLTKKQVEQDFTSIIENAQTRFGENFKNVQKAMYDGFSAGVPQTKKASQQYIQAVGKLSTVGMTDFATAADMLTTTINAFGLSMDDADDAVNRLFNIVKQGKTTIPELAQSFGQISGIAGGLGLKISDIGAALATLTVSGFKTPEAITGVKATLSGLIKPGKSASDVLSLINFKTNAVKLQQEGLTGTLTRLMGQVNKYTKSEAGRKKLLLDIFPNIRAVNAILTLTGKAADSYSDKSKIMNENLDVTNNRFTEIAKTSDQKFKAAMQKLSITSKRLGDSLIPIFTQLIEKVTPLIEKFSLWAKKNPELIGQIGKTILAASALTIGIGALKLVFGGLIALKGVVGFFKLVTLGSGMAVTKVLGLSGAFAKLGLAMKATPWGLIIAGVAAWTFVTSQALDPTKELGKNVGLLTSNWQGFGNMLDRVSAIYNKNKGFLKWMFSGGVVDFMFGTNFATGTAQNQFKAVSDVDRLAQQAGISPALKATQGNGMSNNNNSINAEININVPPGSDSKEIAEMTADRIRKIHEQSLRRAKRLSLGGM